MAAQPITRRGFIEGAAAMAATPFVRSPKATSRRPNVVLIMADDHGAWANGCYHCPDIHTPNIDALAKRGARFDNAFACTPVCSPSRMTYMTGLLPSTHGVQDWLLPADSAGPHSRQWLDPFITYPQIVAAHGYNMAMFGKWHMGKDEDAQCGFRDWSSSPGGGGTYKDALFVDNGVSKRMEGFREDIIGDYATDFLEAQRNSDRPFHMEVRFYAPHTPYNYQPEKYRRWYDNSALTCFPNLPENPAENPELKQMFGKREPKVAYSSLVTAVDSNIGRILQKLKDIDAENDTLIIYTADHGWNAGHHGVWGKGNGTVPLNMFEESIRVPMLWSHPGHIAPNTVLPQMVSSYDFFDTILDYLQLPRPAKGKRVGSSYAPLLRGHRIASRDTLYFEYASVRSLRTETWKYVQRANGWPSELFDLEHDPRETTNLIHEASCERRLNAMHKDLTEYFAKAGAPPIEQWRTTTVQQLPWETQATGPGFIGAPSKATDIGQHTHLP